MSDVTRILAAIEQGDTGASERLLPLVYDELRKLAADRLARELGLRAGELFLDFPVKPEMFGLDLPLVRRDGTVAHLGAEDRGVHLGLPRVAAELYRSARRLRVFTLRPATVTAKPIIELVTAPRDAVVARLQGERALL